MALGATSGHNLCFVWSQQAENNDEDEYEDDDDDGGTDHNLLRTFSRYCSQYFECITALKPTTFLQSRCYYHPILQMRKLSHKHLSYLIKVKKRKRNSRL